MEILNFSTSKTITYPFFCNPKTLYPSNRNTPFHRNLFHFYQTTSTSRKFQTFAHFGRPNNRRNSLRNKFLHDNRVSLNHIPNDPSFVSSNGVEESDVSFQNDGFVELEKEKSKLLGESVLLDKLENWVDQYRKDSDFWGIGSSPIFTVYEDSFGGVKRVLVDEDEILERVRVQRGGNEIEDLSEVKCKILEAKKLARDMENGDNVIARDSSVAKFVVQGEEEEKSGFVKAVRGLVVQPRMVTKLSGVGGIVLCVLVVMFAAKKLFSFGGKEVEYTEMEKKMMMRKVKARKEKERSMKGAVEVIHKTTEIPAVIGVKKPKLDKEQLKNNIVKAKASSDKLVVQNSSGEMRTGSKDMDYKVREIREMARQAREIEGRDRSLVSKDMEMDDSVTGKSSDETEVIINNSKQDNGLSNRQNEVARKTTDSNEILQTTSDDITENVVNSIEHEIVRDDRKVDKGEIGINENTMTLKDDKLSRTPINGSFMTNKSSVTKKPRIIRSVKEAQDYLSKKHDKQNPDTVSQIELGKENITDSKPSEFVDFNNKKQQNLEMNTFVSRSNTLNGSSYSKPDINGSEVSNQKERKVGSTKDECFKDSGIEPGLEDLQKSETTLDREVNGNGTEASLSVEKSFPEVEPTIKPIRSDDTLNMVSNSKPDLNPSEDSDQKDKKFNWKKIDNIKDSNVEPRVENLQSSETSSDHKVNGDSRETKSSAKTENWLEKNFHEVEPIIKQIRAGFRDNYMVAKERVDQPLDIPTEMESLGVAEDGGELDWMQNDHLRDIVFRVRDNELSGRDPFYLMNDEDKEAFLGGLEKKVMKENKKLSHLHEWLHSNIENIDYGADGISIYDSPEKIIPRWKGPSVEKIPESLNQFLDNKIKTASTRNLNPVKKDEKESAKKSVDSSSKVKVDNSTEPKKLKNPKTVVEGSDGSVKAGKKSGKEYWQHTKKWSQEFLDCYNAETDPEVKSIMKDMGKDLDRWITEKEIKEAADVRKQLPNKNKSFVEKKLNKLKREMELFGPQAVVSKYREYTDDKEEDYLWWLDLPYVLCIEVYTVEDGEERIGFYSLEMAPDLELEPKPYHVIAFQDPGDCKNLCYIVQAHMEMLGSGNAFVVARPPKEAFRDAKENGFGVTVIKKGELHLNIDEPLEEVEEQITEIGSKMYHDKIMKDRSVDVNTIMKGVFGFNASTIRLRRKRKLK
ncbi:uncharacterized protein LOC123884346 [Trifolium pratense]|nr:uncharacterized protein LOC123884346 [Trifolium pratense]